MHEVLVNRLGGLSLPRKSVVRLTDRPDMTLDVYQGCKTTMQHGSKGVPAIEIWLYEVSNQEFLSLLIHVQPSVLIQKSCIVLYEKKLKSICTAKAHSFSSKNKKW